MGYGYYSPEIYYDEGLALGLGMGMLTVMIVLYAIVFLIAIAQYVVNGIAMLRIAKKAGVPNGWMAFLPFTDIYLLGKVADVGGVKKNNVKRLMITYCIYFALLLLYIFAALVYVVLMAEGEVIVAALIFFGTAILVLAASIVYSVFFYIAIYRICENFGGRNAVGYFLGMLLGSMFCSSLVHVILLLVLSFKTPASTDAPTVPVTEPSPDSVF